MSSHSPLVPTPTWPRLLASHMCAGLSHPLGQINPRQILNDGVRKHLVRQIAIALHENLIFDAKGSGRKDPKVRLRGCGCLAPPSHPRKLV